MSANSDYSELVNGSSEPEPSAVAATASAAADPDPQLSDPEDTNAQPPEVESVDGEASNSVPEEGILTKLSDADSRTAQSNQDVESDWKADGDRNLVSEEGILNELSDADSRTAQSNQGVESDSKPGNAEADRTFTMRELLSDLKNGDANSNDGREAGTPRHSHPSSEQQIEQNNATMELMESVTGLDEDGRTRQRVLTYTAWRYASTVERNPEDYDAFYNWGLVIQESADNLSPESSHSKDALLGEACKKYEEATRLCPTLNEAYYNWAIALSDRAKMRGRTKEAEEFWKQSAKNYEKAIQLNWNSPQALNNWGLALQELSAIVPAREKQTIVRAAISKFRAAIQLQFDFHRAIYNLGTVLYSLAEDILRTGGHFNSKVTPDEFYSQSAQYIAAANALKPNYPVYTGALKIVRAMLPLPYLKFGYLTAPPVGNPVAPHSDWKRSQFVLNHEGLQQIHKAEHRYMAPSLSSKSGDSPVRKPAIRVNVADIVSVSACADLTLPPGAGLCIDTIHGPVFLVAESWESLDGWVDAIRLVYTIFARGKSDALAGIITA